MITIEEEFPDDVLGPTANGRVTTADDRAGLLPEADVARARVVDRVACA
jgi:hypothetical protein